MPHPTPSLQSGSARFRSRQGKAFESPNAGEVDAVEDHGELSGGEFDAFGGGLWKVVPPTFESRTPKAKAVAAPVQNLDSVGGSVGEDKEVTAQGIGSQLCANEVGESVESEP